MRKLLIAGGALAAGALLARRCASACGEADFAQIVERMPENAPPKWAFRNINAIRENTERILQLLEARGGGAGAEPAPGAR
jgi:hypothetical protein